MPIVLDAMGSDDFPLPEVAAAYEAAALLDTTILLVGQEERLKPLMAKHSPDPRVELVHAPEILEMGDKPARNARRKADNSMAIGMDLIKEGKADAFVTAGNTGGAMANGLFRLGRIPGVKRPALTTVLPNRTGYAIAVDIGANADCKPLYCCSSGSWDRSMLKKCWGSKTPGWACCPTVRKKARATAWLRRPFPCSKKAA